MEFFPATPAVTMWLINVHSLELESHHFHNTKVEYAILSHTWGAEEVSFQEWNAVSRWRKSGAQGHQTDMVGDIAINDVLAKSGFQKILRCCEQARRNGIQLAWVDTCCI